MSSLNPSSAVTPARLRNKVLFQQTKFAEFKTSQGAKTNTRALARTVGSSCNVQRLYQVSCDGTVTMECTNEIGIDENVYAGDCRIKKVIVPPCIEEISAEQFKECKALRIVVVQAESTLTQIGEKAFFNCKNLRKVVFEDQTVSLQFIGDSAFQDCTSLTDVFPHKILTGSLGFFVIGKSAFSGCNSLESFTLEVELPPQPPAPPPEPPVDEEDMEESDN